VSVDPFASSASEPELVDSSPHATAAMTATLSKVFNVFMPEVLQSVSSLRNPRNYGQSNW
jgi:hypothetical protein